MQAVSLLLNGCFRARIVPLRLRCHAGDKKWGDRLTYTSTCTHRHIHMDLHISESSPIHFRTCEMYRNAFLCPEITEHIVLSKMMEMWAFLSNKRGFVVKGLLFLLSVGCWSVSDSRPCPENTWQMSLSGFSVDPQAYYWPYCWTH